MRSHLYVPRVEHLFRALIEARNRLRRVKDDAQNKPLDLSVKRDRPNLDLPQAKRQKTGHAIGSWEPVPKSHSDSGGGWHPVPLKRRDSFGPGSPPGEELVPVVGLSRANKNDRLNKISFQNAVKDDVATEKPTSTPPVICRPSILRPSALSGFGGSPRVSVSSTRTSSDAPSKPAFKLKPSVLSATSSISSSSAVSEPPSKRPKSDDESSDAPTEPEPAKAVSESISSSSEKTNIDAKDDSPDATDVTSSSEAAALEEPPAAACSDISSSTSKVEADSQKAPVSLNGAVGSSDTAAPPPSKPSFIFGQNLQSKVMGVEDEVDSSSSRTNGESASGNLFTGAADSVDQSSWVAAGKSLQESSKELTEREASQKRKYDEVDVVTGEETECNIIQMTCKLYAFDKDAWRERGRGTLRLNDKYDTMEDAGLYSRLVIRTQGTLTVMLNTKVWAGMTVEKVGEKSIRFTACDNEGQPKIYLINGNPKDVHKLYNSLHYRLLEVRKKTEQVETSKE